MNVLAGAVRTSWGEGNKAVSHVRGDDFEQYVKTELFPRESYDILYKTRDYRGNGNDYFTPSRQPDCKYVSKNEGLEFFVETKFRAKFQDQILEWCKFFELKHYQEIDLVIPVLIAIGLGGRPSTPERVFLVPVKHVKFVKLYPSLMQKYEVEPDRPVSERTLKRILA